MSQLTSVFLIFLIGGYLNLSNCLESIRCRNGIDKGDWGAVEFFSGNRFAVGLQIKSDGHTSTYQSTRALDNVGATGLRIFGDGDSVGITSLFAKDGDWQYVYLCPDNGHIIGLDCYVSTAPADDLGVENVRAKCLSSDGVTTTTIDALHGNLPGLVMEKEIASDSSIKENEPSVKADGWGGPVLCSANNFVCGIQTRIVPNGFFPDNLGMSDVIFFCCPSV